MGQQSAAMTAAARFPLRERNEKEKRKKRKKKKKTGSMSFHGSLPVWAEEPSRPSVDSQADRAVHLLADEPGGPGVGLDLGAGEDLVGGENLLLGGSPGLLGLLQLPDENQEQQVSKLGRKQAARRHSCPLYQLVFCFVFHVKGH